MAGVPIKFRCFQCNKLLGAPRSKAGAEILCPKCSARMIVPEFEEDEAELSTVAPMNHAGVPLELLDVNSEDLRVEEGISNADPPKAVGPTKSIPPPSNLEVGLSLLDVREPEAQERHDGSRGPARTAVSPRSTGKSESILPPIAIDEPGFPRTGRGAPLPPRARDLLIPRTVVAAWSLFVLLALGMAFVAGLLAGHFVWKVH